MDVVVRIPDEGKNINKYLGAGYRVLASYGHDLPEKDGSVRPDEDFRITYEYSPTGEVGPEIARALKGRHTFTWRLIPTAKAAAISWHLLAARRETLGGRGSVFHEITKRAVLEAMRQPRGLHDGLIDAYQARRALDYLVGFTLSPVLWRKLHGALGRARAVGGAAPDLRARERDRGFQGAEYWTIQAAFTTPRDATLRGPPHPARRQGWVSSTSRSRPPARRRRDRGAFWSTASRRSRSSVTRRRRSPPPLQQEAARKLGFSAERTMRTAQRLFEGLGLNGETVGLITYMRTDSVQLSGEALAACRRRSRRSTATAICRRSRAPTTRTKNAQEAHGRSGRPTWPHTDGQALSRRRSAPPVRG